MSDAFDKSTMQTEAVIDIAKDLIDQRDDWQKRTGEKARTIAEVRAICEFALKTPNQTVAGLCERIISRLDNAAKIEAIEDKVRKAVERCQG